jgi:hypothetical protein
MTLLDALRSGDPAAAARLGVDEDGFRMAALLVSKLRFERLMQGDRDAAAWFERDPAAFAAAFRRYHAAVRPTAYFPWEESALWRAWSDYAGSSAATRT